MKRVLSAAVAGLMASYVAPSNAADLLMDPPIIEQPQYVEHGSNYGSGFGELSFERMTSRDGQKPETRWNLRGSHAVNFNQTFAIQADGRYGQVHSCCKEDSKLDGTLHLFYRDPNKFAVGAFGHYGSEENKAGKSESVLLGGIEAAAFLNDFSFMGQVGLGQIETETQKYDTSVGQARVRYYMNDNLRFNGTLGGDSTTLLNGVKESSLHLGLSADWRMEQAPVSIFGGYRYEKDSITIPGTVVSPKNADVLFIGARLHWGSKSLRDEERNGVVWAPSGRIGN